MQVTCDSTDRTFNFDKTHHSTVNDSEMGNSLVTDDLLMNVMD